MASIAAALSGRRVMVIRTRHNHYPAARHLLNRWLYKRLTDHLVAISEFIKNGFTHDGFIPEDRLSLIYSTVDTQLYTPNTNGNQFRNELDLSIDELVVGLVAFVIPRKGHRYFLEAAIQILRQNKHKTTFLIVGDGDDALEKELKARVEQEGLEHKILFTGFRADVKSVLSALDIFVLPSLDEGLGMAIIEALAMKKAVVATNVGGIPEMIQHNKTGILVAPKDSAALKEGILTLLENKGLAKELGLNGRMLVEREFSHTVLVAKTEKLYYRLLDIDA